MHQWQMGMHAAWISHQVVRSEGVGFEAKLLWVQILAQRQTTLPQFPQIVK